MWFAVGGVLFIVTAASDYRLFERLAYAVYGVGIVLLIAVLVGGKTVKGSSRWLGFGPFGIQPSELAKIAVIIGPGETVRRRSDGSGAAAVALSVARRSRSWACRCCSS